MFQIRVRESTPSTQPVSKLVDALVDAHRRGVRVSMLQVNIIVIQGHNLTDAHSCHGQQAEERRICVRA